jgi:hypothetical protein
MFEDAKGRGRTRLGSRKAGSLLLFFIVTATACSSQDTPAGGRSGTGGQGDVSCLNGSDGCVSSCSTGPFNWTLGFCETGGAFACPAGYVRLSSCAPTACAQVNIICCDETTGVIDQPACKPDGLFDACPTGSHSTTGDCVPSALGVTDCDHLGSTCGLQGQECTHGGKHCECMAVPGGLQWECPTQLLP